MQGGARLLWQADSILLLATQLRATSWVNDLASLRARLAKRLVEFQNRAHQEGIDPTRVAQAMRVLCALIDHVVTSMPWGVDAQWRPLGKSKSSSALTPAQRVLEVARAAASDAGVSELVYVALALGFDKSAQGQEAAEIEQTLARLGPRPGQKAAPVLETIQPLHALEPARAGSSHPWKVFGVALAIAALILAVLFLGLQRSLGNRAASVAVRIDAVSRPSNAPQEPRRATSEPVAR